MRSELAGPGGRPKRVPRVEGSARSLVPPKKTTLFSCFFWVLSSHRRAAGLFQVFCRSGMRSWSNPFPANTGLADAELPNVGSWGSPTGMVGVRCRVCLMSHPTRGQPHSPRASWLSGQGGASLDGALHLRWPAGGPKPGFGSTQSNGCPAIPPLFPTPLSTSRTISITSVQGQAKGRHQYDRMPHSPPQCQAQF